MNAIETEIVEFVRSFGEAFVSVTEISKNVGNRKNFLQDRTWAKPILRRLEMEGIIEANIFAEYRLKNHGPATLSFKTALKKPGVSDLGDTTIIRLDDTEEEGKSKKSQK